MRYLFKCFKNIEVDHDVAKFKIYFIREENENKTL
jgi:hypothetical protein